MTAYETGYRDAQNHKPLDPPWRYDAHARTDYETGYNDAMTDMCGDQQ